MKPTFHLILLLSLICFTFCNEILVLTNDTISKELKNHQYLLINYYAPWCEYCKQFEPTFEQIAKVLSDRVKVAKIDCSEFPDVVEKYQVNGFPTIKLYKYFFLFDLS